MQFTELFLMIISGQILGTYSYYLANGKNTGIGWSAEQRRVAGAPPTKHLRHRRSLGYKWKHLEPNDYEDYYEYVDSNPTWNGKPLEPVRIQDLMKKDWEARQYKPGEQIGLYVLEWVLGWFRP